MNGYFHDSDDDNLLLDDSNVNMNGCVWMKNGPARTVEGGSEEQLDSPEDSPLLNHERIGTFGHLTVKDFHCHYHQFSAPSDVSKVNRTLYIVTGLCFAFMVTEIIGGYFAGSLAVMTDAAHLFSDMIGFMMSIVSIWISRKPATSSMTFGYHRAEVLGAFLSVLVVWLLASIFCILAIERMISKEYDIDANTMMIVAGLGLVINILMGSVLHGFCDGGTHNHSHGLGERPHAHSHNENINIRAAAAHVIGDLLQSLGVLVAAVTIKIFPGAAIADPICTVLFSVIVVVATMRVARDAVLLLIEANPYNSKEVIGALKGIVGVRHIHSFHVWSLAPGKDAVATHLAVDNTCDRDVILQEATQIVTTKLRVISCTIQVEAYDHDQISLCSECQLVQC